MTDAQEETIEKLTALNSAGFHPIGQDGMHILFLHHGKNCSIMLKKEDASVIFMLRPDQTEFVGTLSEFLSSVSELPTS